jgi:SAM-dependent methyltransferase
LEDREQRVLPLTTIKERVDAEPYWIQKMDLGDGIVTPGWWDPKVDELPFYRLPADMTGLRVLDVGCGEGFFSFETERRGAKEVVAMDASLARLRRFEICRDALGSSISPQWLSVYSLDPEWMGTFDLVMFLGVLCHLQDPLLGIKKVAAVTSGTLLVQSETLESFSRQPLAHFLGHELQSGPPGSRTQDSTVLWLPNAACIRAMLSQVGMVNIEHIGGARKPTFRETAARRLHPSKYPAWQSRAQFRAQAPRATAQESSRTGYRKFKADETVPLPPIYLQNQVGLGATFKDTALITIGRLNMAGLRPDHDVLDIGCGVGRIARFLCDYLKDGGTYEGFDVTEVLVQWCQGNITPLFPNFNFTYTPLFHPSYNPDPSLASAAEFRFPYSDGSFDFVFAQSVFTHLFPEETANYLNEVSRVLRPGGITFLTWILFNDDDPPTYEHPSLKGMKRDVSGTFGIQDTATVGYRDRSVREQYSSCGLTIVEPVHLGHGDGLQDALVAVKSFD